jgi:excisionase family DNA binding protein
MKHVDTDRHASAGEEIVSELLSVAQAARRVGIATETAVRLSACGEFPPIGWLGRKRVVPRRAFDRWLAAKLGDDAAAA